MVLIFQVFTFSYISGLHPAIFRLPVVLVVGRRNSGLATDIFDDSARFASFQYGGDLVPSELDLTHSDLLKGHNQYVGRYLKENEPF